MVVEGPATHAVSRFEHGDPRKPGYAQRPSGGETGKASADDRDVEHIVSIASGSSESHVSFLDP